MFSITDFDIFELFRLLLLLMISIKFFFLNIVILFKTSHHDITNVTTFYHFFVTKHFELFVRKDDNVCNTLDEMFIIKNM